MAYYCMRQLSLTTVPKVKCDWSLHLIQVEWKELYKCVLMDTGELFVIYIDPGIADLLKLCVTNLDTLILVC